MTYLGKSCSFCLPRVPFVNCRQFMYLVISFLVLRAGYGIWLYQFLIIAYLFTLIHFHIQPLLWMSIHCESTSRNHRTELPYEHWEQHHCTGRNQPCSLCNTNHYCQFQSLTSHQLPSLSILHENVFRSQYIRSPCPTPCSIFCKDYTGTWDLGLFRCPQPGLLGLPG